jgi:putative endonuclease
MHWFRASRLHVGRVTGSNPVTPTKTSRHVAAFLFMARLYILYSETLDKFYVGATADDLNQRIRRHLTDHRGFTATAKDWKLVYNEEFDSISDALKREKQIKAWKSKTMIKKLIATA